MFVVSQTRPFHYQCVDTGSIWHWRIWLAIPPCSKILTTWQLLLLSERKVVGCRAFCTSCHKKLRLRLKSCSQSLPWGGEPGNEAIVLVVMEKDIWKCRLHARCSLVLAKMCAVKRVTLALFVCFSGRCNCYAQSFCCYSSANIVMILDSWLCIYLSFAPRPSHRPVVDC